MWKVLIAEDEPPIRRKIMSIVEEMGIYELLPPVATGKEAQESIFNNCPDILITDIQMPVMNGLELIAWIREKRYDIYVIVISGYNDFKFAQKAIEYHVDTYLLKPIGASELYHALSQIRNILEQKKLQVTSSAASDFWTTATKSHTPCAYTLCLVCAGGLPLSIPSATGAVQDFLSRLNMDDIFLPRCQSGGKLLHATGNTPHEELVLILYDDPENHEALSDSIQKAFGRLVSRSNGIPITLLYTHENAPLTTVSSVYKRLREELNYAVRFGCSFCCPVGDDMTLCDRDAVRYPSLIDKFLFVFQYGDFHSFCELFDAEAEDWQKKQVTTWRLYHFFVVLFERLGEALENKQGIPDARSHTLVADILTEQYTYPAMKKEIQEHAKQLFNLKNANSNEKLFGTREELEKIRQFIFDHFSKPITGEDLSSLFGFTPAYLSKLFRQYYHISPSQYIVQLRIQKAKELLKKRSDLTVKQVSGLVGYDDPFHFSKNFKKLTGLSPKYFKEKESNRRN